MTVMPCPQCGEYIEDNLFGTQCKKCGYKVGEGIRVTVGQSWAEDDRSIELMPLENDTLRYLVVDLRAQVSALQTEVKHWKDQHANEVRRARILKDTTDLPLERVRAYELMWELQGQVDKMKEKIDSDNAIMSALQRGGLAFVELPEYWRSVESERDQLRAEVERLTPALAKMENKAQGFEIMVSTMDAGLSHASEKGAETMRERAAEMAEVFATDYDQIGHELRPQGEVAKEVAEAIRALPLKENEG